MNCEEDRISRIGMNVSGSDNDSHFSDGDTEKYDNETINLSEAR